MNDALLTDLLAYTSDPAPDVVVLLRHNGGQRGRRLLDALAGSPYPVVTIEAVRSPRDKAALVGADVRRAGRRIEPEAVGALVDALGSDLRELCSAVDQLIADNNEAPVEAGKTPSLSLPSMSAEAKAMAFLDDGRASYERTAERYHDTIERIAEVLVRIATPQEQLGVFRYRARLTRSGTRMHPSTLVQAHLQLESGCENAIWQKRQRRSRPQNRQFHGMDIYVLLDVSISMTGKNASSAGALAVCLVEGIDRALQLAARDQQQGAVDIRTQLLAFGEGWAELTPLEFTHDHERKRFAFNLVNNPTSEQTLITAALKQVQARAAAEPTRNIVCLVVGDGLFADGLQARKCAMGLPPNVYLAHINIGAFNGLPLTGNFETIQDPALLPEKLHLVLARQLERPDDSLDAR